MARSTQHEWLSFQRFASRRRDSRRRSKMQPHRRHLRIEPLEDRRLLAMVTVNTLADTVDFNDGVTSLREAIFATNLVGGADTIEFAAALTSGGPATLTLTKGELKITDALVINGPGADLLTIDASGNDPTPDENNGDGSRIFNIDDGNVSVRVDVSISGLALTGGDASSIGNGGAIFNGENLTVTKSTITGNATRGSGGGIYSGVGSDLSVMHSSISDNSAYRFGGGILNFLGHVAVTDSTIGDNSAGYGGGGIQSDAGNLTVTGGSISGNSTNNSGGGIAFSGIDGDLAVTGSTVSGNSAYRFGGGILSEYGNLTLADSTISGNSAGYGGGIFSRHGDVTMTGSTLSCNSATYGGAIFSRYGSLAVTLSTIGGNSAGRTGGGISGTNVTVSDSTISGNSAGGGGGGIYSRGTLTVNSSTVSGNTATGTDLFNNGGGISSVFGDLTVTDSTINDNSANLDGGGIFNGYGNLTVTLSTISGNSAGGSGGGIDNRVGILMVIASTISDNSAGTDGGGIHSFDDLTVIGSTISDNSADGSGGGIDSRFGNLTVNDSMISGNSASGDGGGLYSYGIPYFARNTTTTDSTISGNSAGGNGGGIFSRFGGVTMTGSTLSGNSASSSGGGIYVFDATSAIRHSTVTNNSAGSGGGGAFVFGGSLALDHTILAANAATLGPDLTGLIGTTFNLRFSLIGDNANSGLAPTPTGVPDANGNLIGPALASEPLVVSVEMAAMGDFEAGPGGDSFHFEYSLNGGAFQPLFSVSVDEAASQSYYMDSGTQVVRDDPLSVNGILLNKYFQSFSAAIPASSGQIRIRFTATNDGPSEAFVWRNLIIYGENTGQLAGAAVVYNASDDLFAAYAADPDYTIAGDMFGVRSRSNPGIPSLPADVRDDSYSIFPGDTQGIISEYDGGRFFGVVDTVNGVGSNTNTATWTFNNVLLPIDPKLGPLADNFGPTMTHALLADSPARDMGDPAAVAGVGGVPQFDQRGAPFGACSADGSTSARTNSGRCRRRAWWSARWSMKAMATTDRATCRCARRSVLPGAASVRTQSRSRRS